MPGCQRALLTRLQRLLGVRLRQAQAAEFEVAVLEMPENQL